MSNNAPVLVQRWLYVSSLGLAACADIAVAVHFRDERMISYTIATIGTVLSGMTTAYPIHWTTEFLSVLLTVVFFPMLSCIVIGELSKGPCNAWVGTWASCGRIDSDEEGRYAVLCDGLVDGRCFIAARGRCCCCCRCFSDDISGAAGSYMDDSERMHRTQSVMAADSPTPSPAPTPKSGTGTHAPAATTADEITEERKSKRNYSISASHGASPDRRYAPTMPAHSLAISRARTDKAPLRRRQGRGRRTDSSPESSATDPSGPKK